MHVKQNINRRHRSHKRNHHEYISIFHTYSPCRASNLLLSPLSKIEHQRIRRPLNCHRHINNVEINDNVRIVKKSHQHSKQNKRISIMCDTQNTTDTEIDEGSSAFDSHTRLRDDMIDTLVTEDRVFFRSQQINDPDLTANERRDIATGILNDSKEKFLSRFGNYIKLEHLAYFEEANDRSYELNCILRTVRSHLTNHARIIKNRRYAAMQQLIDGHDYFSEIEMMKREPYLYDQLVGQYLTANERNRRDASNVDGPEFSNVLLHGIDMSNIDCARRQQQQEVNEDSDNDNDDEEDDAENGDGELSNEQRQSHNNQRDMICDEQMYPQIPPNYRQHWGDFDDEGSTASASTPATHTPHVSRDSETNPINPTEPRDGKRKEQHQTYISGKEKEMLRKEFFSMMCENFLQGNDKEFDYASVDENAEYDDIETENQEAEDKYFDASSSDDDNNQITTDNVPHTEEASDDELDIYMKNVYELNKNNDK